MNLVSLQFKTTGNFQENLDKLISLINQAPKGAFVLAPELCLNGYAYDRLDEAVEISKKAIEILKELSNEKTISLTLTQAKEGKHINTLFIFNKGEIVHTQSKYELFVLNDEQKYFTAGKKEDIKIVEIDGLKVACLICFELRFIDLWQQIRGADLVLIPAMWGILRKENLETLSQALAVANQCFVLLSDSANDEMAKSSGIITPFGNTFRDDEKEFLMQEIDLTEIKKMRRYLPIGIK
ncbi:MAG: carbon-nitrogen hydrolase family protein [Arcobacteraceae bacterium]|nr:carbon-nitrogen hydrolase family protein [Arcobacteraceae bacterium]